MANTPKLTLLTLFGLVLEDANPAGRATLRPRRRLFGEWETG